MPQSKSGGKGIPTKSSNPQRKVRRARNLAKQPERKLRHILKRNSVREAHEWADKHAALAVLRKLRPEWQKEMGSV